MLNSTIFDVIIGLVFTFMAVSLATSAITEAASSFFGWRAKGLLKGVADLLNDKDVTGLALKIFNHALINPQSQGTAASKADLKTLPSYIDSAQFAKAFVDAAQLAKSTPALVDTAIASVNDQQLKTMLQGIAQRAGGDLQQIKSELAAWFDAGMERISGIYKRWTQLFSFLVALALCIALNIDTLHIGKTFWQQPALAKQIQLAPDGKPLDATTAISKLDEYGLPIGWDEVTTTRIKSAPTDLIIIFIGWLITALSTLFGAPFWFDTLQRFVRLNGTGPQPTQKPNQGV